MVAVRRNQKLLRELEGPAGWSHRNRRPVLHGSPGLALAISFAVIVISRWLSDPLGWYAFDPVMAANGVLAVAGSVAGGLLRGGSTASRVVEAVTYGTFAAIVYALAIITLDLRTDWI